MSIVEVAANAALVSSSNPFPVTSAPLNSAAVAPTNYDSGSAYVASGVIKASPGTLYGISGYNSKATAQFIELFDSTTVPADATAAKVVITVPATSNFSIDFGQFGKRFATGIAWSNSSTSPTKTIGSADTFLEARYI